MNLGWIVKTWCVPPKADAEFVWRMEDVLQTSLLPYDPCDPVVCFDEACKQCSARYDRHNGRARASSPDRL